MGAFRTIVLLVLATWLGCGSAFAEKRVALIIGNSAYKNVPKLTNPVNDASLVAEMFKNAGFDAVTTKLNLNVSEMRKSLREFGASTREADIAVIYYAGHGIELDGNNYLIPTDAALETDADALDETLPLDRVLFACGRAREALASFNSRRLPGQSVRKDDEAEHCHPHRWARSRQGRTDKPEHAHRLCCKGGFDRI
jgi:Caspase domain